MAPNLIFHSKTVLESAKCNVLFFQPMKTIRLMGDLTPSFQLTFMYLASNYLKLNDKWSINYIEIRPFELMDKNKDFLSLNFSESTSVLKLKLSREFAQMF